MKTLAKVGIGCAGVVAVGSVGLALLAPTLLREASQVIEPIQKVKRTQAALDDMVDEIGWKRPEADALTPEQLDRFFAVRERVEAARRHAGPSLDNLPRKNVRSLEELRQVPGIIRDVTGVVGAEMDAFVAVRMPPAEYHWIERLATDMKARAPAPPDGFDPGIHALLLSRIDDVERRSLDDVVAPYIPVPR